MPPQNWLFFVPVEGGGGCGGHGSEKMRTFEEQQLRAEIIFFTLGFSLHNQDTLAR